MGWTRGKRNSVKWSQRNFVCVFSAALAAPLSLWTVAFLFWGDEDIAPTVLSGLALVLVSWRPGVLSNRSSMLLHWLRLGCSWPEGFQPSAKADCLGRRLYRTPGRQDSRTGAQTKFH